MEENLKIIRSDNNKEHEDENNDKFAVEKLKRIALNYTTTGKKNSESRKKNYYKINKESSESELESGEIVESDDSCSSLRYDDKNTIIYETASEEGEIREVLNEKIKKESENDNKKDISSTLSNSSKANSIIQNQKYQEDFPTNVEAKDKRKDIKKLILNNEDLPMEITESLTKQEVDLIASRKRCSRSSKVFKISKNFKQIFLNENQLNIIGYSENITNYYPNNEMSPFIIPLNINASITNHNPNNNSGLSLKQRQKKTMIALSGIHGYGLYLMENAKKHELIIEYVGEIVGNQVADDREEEYVKNKKIDSSYMFRLDSESVIDSTLQGNKARFINHSCMPNSYALKINLNSKKRIAIYANKFIRKHTEITYDYQFAIEEDMDKKIPCLCNAINCKKYLN